MANYKSWHKGAEIDEAIDKVRNLKQELGTSTAEIMSQNAVKEAIEDSSANNVIFNSNNNIELREKTKILGKNENGMEHEILGLNEYKIDETIYDQVEVGSESVHLNLNTNDDETYGERITVDTPNGKKMLAYTDDTPEVTLYDSLGSNEDRAITQKASTELLAKKEHTHTFDDIVTERVNEFVTPAIQDENLNIIAPMITVGDTIFATGKNDTHFSILKGTIDDLKNGNMELLSWDESIEPRSAVYRHSINSHESEREDVLTAYRYNTAFGASQDLRGASVNRDVASRLLMNYPENDYGQYIRINLDIVNVKMNPQSGGMSVYSSDADGEYYVGPLYEDSAQSPDVNYAYQSVKYIDGKLLVCVAPNATTAGYILISSDLQSFTKLNMPDLTTAPTAIAKINDKYVIAVSGTNKLLISNDLSAIDETITTPVVYEYITSNGSKLVIATPNSDTIHYSTDLANWENETLPQTFVGQHIEFTGDYFYYQTANGLQVRLETLMYTPLAIEKGGTNAVTSETARENLDVYSKGEVDTAIQTAILDSWEASY